jgi:hypothetical protein
MEKGSDYLTGQVFNRILFTIMTQEKDKTPPSPESLKSGTEKALDVAAIASYPVGLIAGYKVATTHVRDEATRNLSHTSLYKDLQEIRQQKGNALREELESKSARPIETITKELQELESTFYKGRTERLEKAGIKSTRDYWKHLRASEKFGAVIQGATVSSIIIGAVILMTQSKDIFKDLFDKDKSNSR